jgi:four helix bundle protein
MRLPGEFRERTKRYASAVVRLYIGLPRSRKEVEVLAHQLLRSATSVAPHAREASRARSDAELCSKMDGALQEADESALWLELLHGDCGIKTDTLLRLLSETNELVAILVTIVEKTKRRAA